MVANVCEKQGNYVKIIILLIKRIRKILFIFFKDELVEFLL